MAWRRRRSGDDDPFHRIRAEHEAAMRQIMDDFEAQTAAIAGAESDTCRRCSGDGRCRSCGGTGARPCFNCHGDPEPDGNWLMSCTCCQGTGQEACSDCDTIGSGRCGSCGGRGRYGPR